LIAEDRWVVWDFEWRNLWSKVPFQPNGKHAKSNDPTTWASFDAVRCAFETGYAGIGFMLGDGFVGIDLDDCLDPESGKLTRAAKEIGRQMRTYAEISPSGRGVKLIARGEWNGDWHRKTLPDGGGEIEVYPSGRFFTMTGNRVSEDDVIDAQPALNELGRKFAKSEAKKDKAPAQDHTEEHTVADDDELIRRACGAENGEKFSRLWDGDVSGYPSPSEADLALCGMLAFWTGGDAERIDRLFRRSGLLRGKWDERHGAETYGAMTIAKALGGAGTASSRRPKPSKPSVADVLVEIAERECELWHDEKWKAYASVGRRSMPVQSTEFRLWLTREYYKQHGKAPNGEARSTAINTIVACARFDGAEHVAHTRVAQHDGRIYLHLADEDDTVVAVGSDGWDICEDPGVRFTRPAAMRPLPMPTRGGDIDELRHFINASDDDQWVLLKAWFSTPLGLGTDGPFPLCVLTGEQGSAKTTTGKMLQSLTDPSALDLACEPRDPRDLMIATQRARLLAFDNISHITPWMSDAFCRLATGGGFATRELYTDADEVIFTAKRPVLLTGITDFVTRGDLLDRSVLIRLAPIPEERRRLESELWAEFKEAQPRLLGALLDRVAGGLRELPNVKLDRLPRMADFARFAVACERGAGEPARFQAAYAANRADATGQALESSPIIPVLLDLMRFNHVRKLTASEWLAELTDALPKRKIDDNHSVPITPHGWPKRANEFGNQLRRLAPDLRAAHGLDVRFVYSNRSRVIQIERLGGPDADS
jgi:hypothetical protein